MDNTELEKSNQSQSVLIVSHDPKIAETIGESNTSGLKIHSRETWEDFISEPELLANNCITLLDIDGFDDTKNSVKQLIKIKQDDPTQVLMLLGEKEELGEFLKLSSQALIYRAFTKPVHPNQILLTFKRGMEMHDDLVVRREAGEDLTVVGPAENRATLDTISESRKTNPFMFIAAGLAAVAVVGWLAFSSSKPQQEQTPIGLNTPQIIESDSSNESLLPNVAQIEDLNELAANAFFDGRLISPPGQNALGYYNQVLEIDSYDNTAYEGRQLVANKLRENYTGLIKEAKFDEAVETLDVLRELQPLNTQNEAMALALEKQVEEHVTKVRSVGSPEEIAKTKTILTKIEPKIKSSKSLGQALEAETKMLEKIDLAIDSGSVLPSQDGSAYNLISSALKDNSISQSNIKPRLLSLSDKLMQMASSSFNTDELDDTARLLDLVKPLKVNKEKLKIAETKLQARQKEVALASIAAEPVIEEVSLEQAEPESAKITPAKLVKRTAPSYPRNASQRNIEGWVELSFDIDTQGKPKDIEILAAEPSGIFEREALRSVKKWRFEPAWNEQTNEPVIATVESTKVTFKLQ